MGSVSFDFYPLPFRIDRAEVCSEQVPDGALRGAEGGHGRRAAPRLRAGLPRADPRPARRGAGAGAAGVRAVGARGLPAPRRVLSLLFLFDLSSINGAGSNFNTL